MQFHHRTFAYVTLSLVLGQATGSVTPAIQVREPSSNGTHDQRTWTQMGISFRTLILILDTTPYLRNFLFFCRRWLSGRKVDYSRPIFTSRSLKYFFSRRNFTRRNPEAPTIHSLEVSDKMNPVIALFTHKDPRGLDKESNFSPSSLLFQLFFPLNRCHTNQRSIQKG